MKFEYIISGVSMFRLHRQEIAKKPELCELILNFFKKFNDYYMNNNISLLYNAFTESDYKDVLNKFNVPLYLDSGGLQMITLKKQKVDDQAKNKIYEAQSSGGDYAMCFDEIPLYIDDNKRGNSARTDMSGKYVIGEEMYDKGVLTGKNISNQIKYFIKQKSKAKTYIILQGNSFDDWMNFSDGVFSQLQESDYDYVHGLAIADTCLGNGCLEMADMLSIIPFLKCPDSVKKNIHLLGVGSINRLLPAIIMVQSGYLDSETSFTYDSTSLSSSHIYGRYYDSNDNTIDYIKLQHKNSLKTDKNNDLSVIFEIKSIMNDIKYNAKKIGWDQLYDFNDLFETIFIESTRKSFNSIIDMKKDYFDHLIVFHLIYTLSQIVNFTEKLRSMFDKQKRDEHIEKYKKLIALRELENVNNYKTYQKWKNQAIRTGRIQSNRIKRVDTNKDIKGKKYDNPLEEILYNE